MNAVADDLGELRAIGRVSSPLVDRAAAPKQGDEGAPEATLEIAPEFEPGLDGVAADDELLVLTWLDRARPLSPYAEQMTGALAARGEQGEVFR